MTRELYTTHFVEYWLPHYVKLRFFCEIIRVFLIRLMICFRTDKRNFWILSVCPECLTCIVVIHFDFARSHSCLLSHF